MSWPCSPASRFTYRGGAGFGVRSHEATAELGGTAEAGHTARWLALRTDPGLAGRLEVHHLNAHALTTALTTLEVLTAMLST